VNKARQGKGKANIFNVLIFYKKNLCEVKEKEANLKKE
jgi:hypothetical protein